jgi:hypothetical protein
MKILLIALGALLIPAAGFAQPAPNDPDTPTPTLVPPVRPTPPPPPTDRQAPQPTPQTPQPTPQTPQPTSQTPQPAELPASAPIAPVVINPVPTPVSYTRTEPQYEEVTDAYNAPMFTTGALVFAASYGASVVVAAASNNDRGNQRLYVPVLGPWLALNDRGSCDITKSSCDHETTAKVLLVADGVFQAAGIIGMIDGILQPTSRRVVTRSAKLDTKLHVKPTAVHGDPGVAVWARF